MNELVFGIGLGKTGTKSLARALDILRYNCLQNSAQIAAEIKRDREAARPFLSQLVDTHSAFVDHPIWRHFKELDKLYPGSKFIWTVRDLDSWLDSRKRHIEFRKERIRRGESNVPPQTTFIEADERRRYARHSSEVAEYFKGREFDLLTLAVCDGEGWEKLCPFLGKAIPAVPFPYERDKR